MRTLVKLSWVEVKLLLREPLTVVFALALPLMILYVLGGVSGEEVVAGFYRDVEPMSYYVPVYIGLVIASIGLITIPTHLAGYRERGVLKRLHASSMPAWAVGGAEVVVAVVIATTSSLLLVAAAALVYDFAAPNSLLTVVGAFLLAVFMFAALGVLLGAVLPTARAAQALGLLLWFMMLMLAGAGPPPEAMPSGMRTAGSLTPLKHVIYIMQDAWLGLDAGQSLLVVVAILVLSILLALRFFRWE